MAWGPNIETLTRIDGKLSHYFSNSFVPISFKMQDAGGGVIALGGAIFGGSLLFLLLLIVTGQFATISSVWPASNVTKITTNIANSVVTGTNFLTLIIIGAAVGIVILVFGLALKGLSRMKGG